MTTSLCFNDFTFSPVTHDNEPWTNVARDLAQFSARFGRPLTYKLSKLAHYMQSPEKNFSGPLYLCFGFRIRLHLQPQAFAP